MILKRSTPVFMIPLLICALQACNNSSSNPRVAMPAPKTPNNASKPVVKPEEKKVAKPASLEVLSAAWLQPYAIKPIESRFQVTGFSISDKAIGTKGLSGFPKAGDGVNSKNKFLANLCVTGESTLTTPNKASLRVELRFKDDEMLLRVTAEVVKFREILNKPVLKDDFTKLSADRLLEVCGDSFASTLESGGKFSTHSDMKLSKEEQTSMKDKQLVYEFSTSVDDVAKLNRLLDGLKANRGSSGMGTSLVDGRPSGSFKSPGTFSADVASMVAYTKELVEFKDTRSSITANLWIMTSPLPAAPAAVVTPAPNTNVESEENPD